MVLNRKTNSIVPEDLLLVIIIPKTNVVELQNNPSGGLFQCTLATRLALELHLFVEALSDCAWYFNLAK